MESQPVQKSSPPSIVSADLKIVGDLNSVGEIQVDGTVDGDIRTKSLLVGETAQITGEIVADSVFVHGTINGQIKSRSVNLASTAHVVGDILHLDLAIETGAFLEGHCKRMAEPTKEAQTGKEAQAGKMNVVGKEPANRPVSSGKPQPVGTTAQSKGSLSGAANEQEKKAAVASS